MKDKLNTIKDKLITLKDGTKRFFGRTTAFVKKSFSYIKNMIRFAGLVLLVAVALFTIHTIRNPKDNVQVITEYFVAEELKNIGEVNTEEYTYTIERSTSESRKIFNCDVPLTEKSLSVLYSGQVEIGYNIADMDHRTIGKLVWLDIPEPVVENHITKEVVRDEDNNIFNPINAEDYSKLRDGVLDEGLKKAIAKGSYEAAETNLKSILKTHFEEFGYSVMFI